MYRSLEQLLGCFEKYFYISERGYDFDRLLSDEHVISLVSRFKPDAVVVRPHVRDGEFIIFYV